MNSLYQDCDDFMKTLSVTLGLQQPTHLSFGTLLWNSHLTFLTHCAQKTERDVIPSTKF